MELTRPKNKRTKPVYHGEKLWKKGPLADPTSETG